MTALLIQNARLLDPAQGIDRVGSVLWRDGRIVWWGGVDGRPSGSLPADVLDGMGLVVCPGFMDLHCHLREPGFEAKETIASGTLAAARGGFTTVCCMPNTNPPLDSVEAVEYVKTKAEAEGIVNVVPIACVTKGRAGKELVNMGALAVAGVAGFSDDGDPVRDENIMRRALETGKKLQLPIIDHCEEPVGGPPDGEVRMVERDVRLAAETGGWVHIAHVSVAGSVEVTRKAKQRGIRATAEATPHHVTLTQEAIGRCGTMAKVNPPLRTESDRQALLRGLKDGTIDIVATDHAPHTAADKQKDYSAAAAGISGFETAFGSLMTLVHRGEMALEELIAYLTIGPATLLGRLQVPQSSMGLVVGRPVDITVFDPEREWVVDPDGFASRGKNTPLAGMKLKGRVVAALCRGKIAYIDRSLSIKKG